VVESRRGRSRAKAGKWRCGGVILYHRRGAGRGLAWGGRPPRAGCCAVRQCRRLPEASSFAALGTWPPPW